MNIHRALSDIADIRAQLERTESMHGFRSAAVGLSVGFLVVGFAVQRWLKIDANVAIDQYLTIWLAVAAGSALTAAVEMIVRGIRRKDESVWKLHRQLSIQIFPCVFVGCAVTLAIAADALEQQAGNGFIWALPAIWSMVYGLGLLSCTSRLPRYSNWVAFYFLIAGTIVLAIAFGTRQPDGFQMLLTFGVGHAGLATVLHLNLDREKG